MEDIFIVGAARTPIGKFGGALAKMPASDLGALVIRKVLERAGVQPEQVSEVIIGQVLTAGVGQNPARQAAMKAGLPNMIPSMTINKVCGSGLKAAMLGAQAIANGDSDIVIAGGQESMSLSPHAMMGSRDGFRMGDAKLVDTMIVDGLWDVYNQYHMGVTAENVAKEYAVTREEQDEFAVKSQNKAEAAQKAGRFSRRDHPGRDRLAQRPGDLRRRRVSAPRRDARGDEGAQARVRQERQRHRRQCLGHQRRRRRRRSGIGEESEGAGLEADRAASRHSPRPASIRSTWAWARCRRRSAACRAPAGSRRTSI